MYKLEMCGMFYKSVLLTTNSSWKKMDWKVLQLTIIRIAKFFKILIAAILQTRRTIEYMFIYILKKS